MGEMKVEHVLLFLVGAFLVYHMMGKCGRVEGFTCSHCTNPFASCLISGNCRGARNAKDCNDRGGTWCPDHVDIIPGQTGPTAPNTKAWCMEHTQNKLDAGLIDTNDFWRYYRACQSEY